MSNPAAFAGLWTSLPVPLTSWILEVIQSMGHTQMTPVQASTIPLFMQNKDVVVEAVTGSGKTLAFVIPILERLIRRESKLKKNEIGALIVTPTRELATQIHSIFSLFLSAQPNFTTSGSDSGDGAPVDPTQDNMQLDPEAPKPLEALLLISSDQSSPIQDIKRFLSSGADIIIGTPGRVEEFLLGRGKTVVSSKELEVLVLDEADRLLDLGFQNALTRIITHLPKQRRTGLFSATMTDADALSELVRVGLRNPARVVVKVQTKKSKASGKTFERGDLLEERRIPANLKNYYINCLASEKLVQLGRIIHQETSVHNASHFIVYFATCACVDYFYAILPHILPPSTKLHSLHGHLPPSARTRTLATFSSSLSLPSSPSILLATDVAARGLDLPHVDVVVQFDPPSDPKAFSHRCGRTARAGRSGKAYTLLVDVETDYVDFMAVRKIPLGLHAYIQADESVIETASSEHEEDPCVNQNLQRIRQHLATDRALNDKAVKAFVSFVRAYSKHEASYIFRVKDLDLVGIAKSFGLLRLPRMPELKGANRETWQDALIDWDTYAYADKAQEVKRLAEAETKNRERESSSREAAVREKKKENAAWSQKTAKREEKDKRKDKRFKKKRWLRAQQGDETVSTGEKREREISSESGDDGDDWDELAKEERLAKKVRKGVSSQAEFDMEFADL